MKKAQTRLPKLHRCFSRPWHASDSKHDKYRAWPTACTLTDEFAGVTKEPGPESEKYAQAINRQLDIRCSNRRKLQKLQGGHVVNWDQIKGRWNQTMGTVKKQWGKLTDDDLAVIDGQRERLVGKIQEKYGIAKEEADKQVKTWESMKVNEREERGRPEEKRKAG